MIRVSNIMNALDVAKDINSVISIVDHDVIVPTFTNPHHMIVNFADTNIFTDMFAPVQDDINRIFDFASNKSSVLVHCEGGISRSTAIGIGLLVARNKSVADAINLIHIDSPNMSPNKLVLQLIDNHLGLNNTLVKDVSAIVATLPQGLQLWCNDCKVHFTDGNNCPGNHWG